MSCNHDIRQHVINLSGISIITSNGMYVHASHSNHTCSTTVGALLYVLRSRLSLKKIEGTAYGTKLKLNAIVCKRAIQQINEKIEVQTWIHQTQSKLIPVCRPHRMAGLVSTETVWRCRDSNLRPLHSRIRL